MRKRLLLVASIMILIGVGCATIAIDSDYDRNADFARYLTYNWVEGFSAPLEESNPMLHRHIVTLIEEELDSKGYQKSDNPDMAIAYTTTTKEMQDISTYSTSVTPYYSHGFYRDWWYDPRWSVGTTTTRVDTYTEGTLMMGFFDKQTEKLIWRSWATATIRDTRDLEKIDNAIEYMLSKFPPGR